METKTKPEIENMKLFFGEVVQTVAAKNNDYSGSDFFYNFKQAERVGVTIEQGLLVRINDKFSRICQLMSGTNQEVNDESIDDTIADLVGYLGILSVYRRKKNKPQLDDVLFHSSSSVGGDYVL